MSKPSWFIRLLGLAELQETLTSVKQLLAAECFAVPLTERQIAQARFEGAQEALRALVVDGGYGAASGYYLRLRNEEEANQWLAEHIPLGGVITADNDRTV